ncbi:acyltransferase family protein [Glaciibacter sp. 2TAF33]|uniref:acyltransferase family protein n=1 Tax=Glaciibacter sp. 2TAF33 TaxID=3233015 RepID=UPI003F8F3C58
MTRNRELDSLRGIAAVAVLLYHTLATNFPALQSAIQLTPVTGVVNNLLAYTPLHSLWLGAESVWLFFVLSGFVLTRSALRPSFSWEAYYPSRIVRLYLPVLFAIGLAWISYALVPHVATPSDGGTLDGLPTDYALGSILRDVTLIGGTSTSLGVLWSLQWEVLFSLALPLYVFLVRRHPFAAGITAGLACIAGWSHNDPTTSYLPIFFFGALLAQHWPQVARFFSSFLATGSRRSHVLGSVLALSSVCALSSFFLLGPSLQHIGLPPRVTTLPVVLVGICLLIVTAQLWGPLTALLSWRPLVYLGTISYSLYLVHLPIVIAVAFALHIGKFSALLAVALSFILAVLFHRFVEKPAHDLSKRVGTGIRSRSEARSTRSAHPGVDAK